MSDPAATREDNPVVPKPRMDPALRRVLEAGALGALCLVLLQFRWWDDTRLAARHVEPPEVTTIVKGHGKLGQVEWWLRGRTGQGGSVRFELVARPLDENGVKQLRGIRYQVRGSSVWSANGFAKNPVAGQPSLVTVSATVPAGKEAATELELRLPASAVQQGRPRPVLRFAR